MKQLRIMTFNIQHCMNFITRKIDYPLFAETIAKSGADIVGLNEVRGQSETDGYDAQAQILAENAGYKYFCFAKAIEFGGRDPYGNAVLSKYPIISAETVMIPDPSPRRYHGYYETRCAAKLRIDTGDGELTVISVHFGLNRDEHENARDTVLSATTGRRCVLMGDMNVTPASPILSPIRERMTDTADSLSEGRNTFPSNFPRKKIDYIFVSPDVKVKDARVPKLIVSDHRPVVADLELN